MKNRLAPLYVVFTALLLTFSGLVSAQDKNDANDPEIAAAIASVKATRALKANVKLTDAVASKWNFYQAKSYAYLLETQKILNEGYAEEKLKKDDLENKEFLKEVTVRNNKVYKEWHTDYLAQEYPLMIAERTAIQVEYNALSYYYKQIKTSEPYLIDSGMNMAMVAKLYLEVEKTAKKHSKQFIVGINKMKSKEAEMKEIRDDAKMWIDIQFDRGDKKAEVKEADVKKADVKKAETKK
ncbi:MAG: hypothetical protein HRT89_25465 [Lentisphaeria bacterium]|nr:hypothetical protein [Lentisphaeria bacterium]